MAPQIQRTDTDEKIPSCKFPRRGLAASAMAGTVSYHTFYTPSDLAPTLSCGAVAGCVQNTMTSVTVGGLTLTYNFDGANNVVTPSFINLGNIVSMGSGTNVNLTGLFLTVSVPSRTPGSAEAAPVRIIYGMLSTNNSSTY